ncbi:MULTISPECIES: GIY-YIG nuclease family protein [Aeromonas]|uniref:GIY-YIG nuclease family protein n=1 Tax=Aeromonas TaxID=642 RepID=UPI001C2437AF|nr:MULTISPECIES: GIY-YIG nuclease family protein [Aeromonas]QWZ82204.1 hypothetical protein I6L44_04610 [Aeromonas sp. FDAARGOS 1414]
MIKISGYVVGAHRCSYIYLIKSNEYIYVGETGSFPVIRWGAHLSSSGTFTVNMKNHVNNDEGLINAQFICFECTDILKEADNYKKIARRAIEAELHRQLSLNPWIFGEEIFLVSRSPNHPVRHKFTFDPVDCARKIMTMLPSIMKDSVVIKNHDMVI